MRRHVWQLLTKTGAEFPQVLFAPADFQKEAKEHAAAPFPFSIASRPHPIQDRGCILQLADWLQNAKPCIHLVHAHGIRGAMIGVPAARRAGIPALVTLHNLPPRAGLLTNLLLRSCLSRAQGVITVSQAIRHALTPLNLPAIPLKVISNGVELAAMQRSVDSVQVRKQYTIPDGVPVITAAGRFAREKGFAVLLEAIRLLQRVPEFCLTLAGSGPQENALREQAKNLPVIFTGFVQDLASILSISEIVVVPSLSEGQSLVALEAMAAGKAVIASRVGGLVETVREEETGLLVAPSNPHALAAALERLLTHPAEAAAMGSAGRQRVETYYTLERMIEVTEAFYREIIFRGKG
jgi:glycosyltransferase involved in cell wall biosynthesis